MFRISIDRNGLWLKKVKGRATRLRLWSLVYIFFGVLVFLSVLGLAVNRESKVLLLLGQSLIGSQKEFPSEAIAVYTENNVKAIESLMFTAAVGHQSRIPSVDLVVENNALERMYEAINVGDPDLGHDIGGDRPYVNGYYRDESGKIQKCNASYRGMTFKHHMATKPSLRIKIKKKDIELGRRFVEIQRPEDVLALCNWLPTRLAKELSVMADLFDHVRLFVNGKYYGLYERHYRAGEPLTVLNHKMPGTFFKGDLTGLQQHTTDLWSSVKSWKEYGEESEVNASLFEQFLQVLRRPHTLDTLEEFELLIDFDAFAKVTALYNVTQSNHVDSSHNHLYYTSTNTGRLEPVFWDPNGYMRTQPRTLINSIKHPVMDWLTRDPRWIHERNRYVFKFISGTASAESQQRLISDQYKLLYAELRADPNLSIMGYRRSPLDLAPALQTLNNRIQERSNYLKAYLSNARLSVYERKTSSGELRTQVRVFGDIAVQVRRRDGTLLVGIVNTGRMVGKDSMVLYPGLTETFPRLPSGQWEDDPDLAYPVPCALVYEILGSAQSLEFINAVTGEAVTAERQKAEAIRATDCRSIHPWHFSAGKTESIVLGPGVETIETDLHVEPTEQLIVEPGTELRLAPGIGIYCRGQAVWRGTKEEPITITQLEEGKPWGAIAIFGARSEGSNASWVTCHGGSVGAFRFRQFKGMFNVYNCPKFEMSDCSFGENFLGDDTVNLAESKCRIRKCSWTNSLSDGLDMDMCSAVISECRWDDAGGDAIDLMGCDVLIWKCEIRGSGDKAISIGEATTAYVRKCFLSAGKIGVQIKDGSRAMIVQSKFTNNETALHGYRKKWLYNDGGRALIDQCEFKGNDIGIWPESRSGVWILRSDVAVEPSSLHRVISTTSILDDDWTLEYLKPSYLWSQGPWKADTN